VASESALPPASPGDPVPITPPRCDDADQDATQDDINEPSDEVPLEEITTNGIPLNISQREMAVSKYHLLDHRTHNPNCRGCQAKARNKRHFQGAFHPDKIPAAGALTMDQLSLADVDGTLGIGKYKYAMVVVSLIQDY